MEKEFRMQDDSGTELGRSPSGVPESLSRPVVYPSPESYGEERRSPPPLPPEERPEAPGEMRGSPQANPEGAPRLTGRKRGPRALVKPEARDKTLSAEERLLVLDTWKRSGLPASEFAAMVGLSPPTLYVWRRKFLEEGPGGLLPKARGRRKGSRLPEITKRTILMLKDANPDWGTERISHMLLRGPALPASPGAVAKVLRDAGYVLEDVVTEPHDQKPRSFERARPNQLWQTDLFTFILRRQNRRVYLVAFLDDHSRFIVGYGLHATQSAALVIECFRAAVTSYQAPEEVLTDNGAQYVTWRGKSAFAKELEGRGIRHIVASPRRPQTLGKTERFWGTLWRECLERAVFIDLADAAKRIGHFIDHYNFERPHSSLGGLVPADRYFGAAPEMLRTLKERVAKDALRIAREGIPRAPFYLAGSAGGESFSVHAEGERVILRRGDGEREEIDLGGREPAPPEVPVAVTPVAALPDLGGLEETPPPGVSGLDEALRDLRKLEEGEEGAP
jgi:transposase InsO family protein